MQEPSAYSLKKFCSDVIAAIRGTQMSYTQGSIPRAVFVLAVPMVLEMLMESVFVVVDIFFVSSLGPSAVATVGLTESVLTLVYAVGIGFAMATTALVARRTGEQDSDGAARIAVQSIVVGLVAAIPFMIVGLFFAKELLEVMGGDAWTIEHGYRYTFWMFSGNFIIILLFIMNAIFRGAGDAVIAMRVLWLSNGINIFLDPALIFGWGPFPEMGIEGAALATNIGRGAGVLLQLFVLSRGAKHIRILKTHLRLQVDLLKQLVKTSAGGIGQFIIATSSWIGLVRIVSEFGSEVLAGYTIGIRIIIFTFLPAWGLSNAAATLVGQNLGAKQPERASRSVVITGWVNMAFLAVVSFVYVVFSEFLVRIFTSEPTVVASAVACLRTVSYGYLIYAWGMVLVQAFNGAGDTLTPTKINFFCLWLLQIPLAYILAMHFDMQQAGVYWSILLSQCVSAGIAMVLFRRGRWKLVEV